MSSIHLSTHHVLVEFTNGGVYFVPYGQALVISKAFSFGSVTCSEASEIMKTVNVSTLLKGCMGVGVLRKYYDADHRVCFSANRDFGTPTIHEFYHSRSQCYHRRQSISRGDKQYALSVEDTGDIFLVSGRFVEALKLASERGCKVSRCFNAVLEKGRDASLYRSLKMLRHAGIIDEFGRINKDIGYHLVEVLPMRKSPIKQSHLSLVKAA